MSGANLVCLILILLLPSTVLARGEQLPDADFLEFLGRYETSTGKAIDPLQFADNNRARQKKEQPAAEKPGTRRQQLNSRRKPEKDQDYEK